METVTRGSWTVTLADVHEGVEIGVYQAHAARHFKDRQYRIQYGELNGLVVGSREQAEAICLTRGYLKPYTRNNHVFVMSRTARKRGMTTTDTLYNSQFKRRKRA
jgi:hypothetical protein